MMGMKGIVLALCLAVMPQAFAGQQVKLTEGTEVRLRMADKLSSANATEGQRFNLEVEDDVVVNGQTVVPRGTKAVGTVMSAKKKGFMGKGGELNVMLDYMLVNDERVRLRSAAAREGNDKVGATVALTVLFGPLGLLKRGHDVEMNPGTMITAFVDQTTVVWVP